MINDQALRETRDKLESLLRLADDELAGAKTPGAKARYKRRRNALNAACNAMHRAVNA